MEELTQDGAQLARTILMAAAQLAESMARVQAQRASMAQSRSTAQAAQVQQQIIAERDAARMIFRPLTDDRYWQNAHQLDRVVQAYKAAASWAEHDPEARAAVQLIKQYAEERWGRAVGEAMHIPESNGADPDHDLGDTPMTAKQRKFLIDLGIEPGDGLTKTEASQAIEERLQIGSTDVISRERPANSRHDAEVVETALVEGISPQPDTRVARLREQVMSSARATADAEAKAARRQATPAVAQPIQRSLQARRSQANTTRSDTAVTTRRLQNGARSRQSVSNRSM